MKYVNLVIDNKSDHTDNFYTYRCESDDVVVGNKVFVPFAKGNRLREAYVVSQGEEPEDDIKSRIKTIEKMDEDISLSSEMVNTALWMKNRYVCRYIDAIKCFTPAGEKAKRGERKNPLMDEKGELSLIDSLTNEQWAALDEIKAAVLNGEHERFLLHGVTGSGKTEIYIRTVKEILKQERTAIVLVPEISLTGQIIDRFAGAFGNENLAVLHSRLSRGERYDQWKRIRDGKVKVVIGARSAVFAPLEKIGVIIVDEEHESTYKSDYTPKYDTVEVAIKRLQAPENKGILLLGSATPSVVTYSRAEEGIYKLLKLTERYNKVQLPEVSVVDMRDELKKGNRSIISNQLYDLMTSNLKEGRQVILFLNRRGYSTFVSCRECGYVAKCPDCGVSLTYHKKSGMAHCHYCGYKQKAPTKCPDCGSKYIKYFGIGTEKLQETVEELFSEYNIDRVDLDTVAKKGELKKRLKSFRDGKTHILIGTQLIAKGLDFRNVGLVGVISADVTLNIPDFRSPERTFQLITQAAGRAGRGDKVGQVVIQTYSPDNYAIKCAAAQNYEEFYQTEIMLRKYMEYPPFSDLIQVVFTSEREEDAAEAAQDWYRRLKAALQEEEQSSVLPPQQAYLSKIKETYRYSMLVKCPKGKRLYYSMIMEQLKENDRKKRKKNYTAVVDINPYSFV